MVGVHFILTDTKVILIRITERIHSGVRPHVCDHPGCGKQFIQRSALTVHTRVHTGEKPHMCEHCTKVWSLIPYAIFGVSNPSPSHSAIQVLSRDIEGYILEKDHTNVHTSTARKHLRDVRLLLVTRVIILEQWKNQKHKPMLSLQIGHQTESRRKVYHTLKLAQIDHLQYLTVI